MISFRKTHSRNSTPTNAPSVSFRSEFEMAMISPLKRLSQPRSAVGHLASRSKLTAVDST